MNLVSLSNTSEEGGSGVKWMMWQNVTCVASLLQRRANWGGTTWSTLASNFINVAVVTTHVVELINWRPIPTPILGRNLTNVWAVTSHALKLVIWRDIPSLILGRSPTNVAAVPTHALELVVWRDIPSLTLGRSFNLCGSCDYSFTQVGHLKRHMMAHWKYPALNAWIVFYKCDTV